MFLIQFSTFESKPTIPSAAAQARFVTAGLPCAGRCAGASPWTVGRSIQPKQQLQDGPLGLGSGRWGLNKDEDIALPQPGRAGRDRSQPVCGSMATSHVAFNTSFKGKQTTRPLLERGSSCYRRSCHPLLNCGNHGNESSHSCWWYSPVTLAKSPMSTSKPFIIAPHKTRENHENEQGLILLTFRVCSTHLLQEGKYTTDFISSPLICILQRQTPQTQRPGLSDLARVYKQLQLQHSAPPLTLHCPRPASMFTTMREKWFPKQKKSKSKFCFYAA